MQKQFIKHFYSINTTLLLPGSCNANCDFCYWNREERKIEVSEKYIEQIVSILNFTTKHGLKQLSISGGEPTISPYFDKILSVLEEFRRNEELLKIVLTTNGSNLRHFLERKNIRLNNMIDHINISRHGITDEENFNIFKSKSIPTNNELKTLISDIYNNTECDVTFNCVISNDRFDNPNDLVTFCNDFIAYSKELGVNKITFRKECSDLTPTYAEYWFVTKYGKIGESSCPVCRSVEQNVNDTFIIWQTSVKEPSVELDSIYELVIHPDGKLYYDWGMAQELSLIQFDESYTNWFKTYIVNKDSDIEEYILNVINGTHFAQNLPYIPKELINNGDISITKPIYKHSSHYAGGCRRAYVPKNFKSLDEVFEDRNIKFSNYGQDVIKQIVERLRLSKDVNKYEDSRKYGCIGRMLGLTKEEINDRKTKREERSFLEEYAMKYPLPDRCGSRCCA